MSVIFVKQLSSVFEPPFGGLWVTYAIYLQLVGKLVVDFFPIGQFDANILEQVSDLQYFSTLVLLFLAVFKKL